MLAIDYDHALAASLSRFGVIVSESDARTLRRAEKTLRRWGERECGDSYDTASFYVSHAIERDGRMTLPVVAVVAVAAFALTPAAKRLFRAA